MKNLFLLFYLSVYLFFSSCSQTTSAVATVETIVVTPSVNQEEFFSRFIDSIEIVPLETKDESLSEIKGLWKFMTEIFIFQM